MNEQPLPPELAVNAPPIEPDVLDAAIELWSDAAQTDLEPSSAVEIAAYRWQITDTGSAEWAMRQVVAATEEAREIRMQAQEWRRRIDEWEEHELRRPESRAAFFSGHLERYALERRLADEKQKTLVLPAGSVATTRSAPKLVVDDELALLAWLRDHVPVDVRDRVVKTTETVRLTELREVAELVPFTTVTLSCGHEQERLGRPDEIEPDTKAVCEEHGEMHAIVSVTDAVSYVPLVAGVRAPGVDVSYPAITAKVKPG